MGSGGDAKTAYGVEGGEVDAGEGSKDEFAHGEGVAVEDASAGKEDVVVGAEEEGGDEDGGEDGVVFLHAEGVLKEHHQEADEDESEDEFFVDAGADAGDDVDHEHALGQGFDGLLEGDQCGGGRRDGLVIAVEQEAQDDEGDGQEDAFEGHGDEVAESDLPFCFGGDLEADEDDDDHERGGNPCHAGAKADEFEEVLYPDEGDDPDLRLGEGFGEGFGVDQECADLVEEHEADEVGQRVDGAAGSIQV